MSDYVKIYDVFEECGLSQSVTLAEACEAVANWINEKFSDILTASYTDFDTSKGSARVVVYEKNSSKIGFYFGSASASVSYVSAGYINDGTCNGGTSADGTNFINFGTSSNGDLSKLKNNVMLLKLVIIKGEYGFAADFIAPAVNANKKVMYTRCDGLIIVNIGDKLYAEKDGTYYDMSTTLPPQSGYSEKVLSRFALPNTGILPEHLYLSDTFIGSNNPYSLNGKNYVDLLFCSATYMGFAMEL